MYSYTAVEPDTNLHSVVCTSASFCMVTSTPSGSMAWDGSHWTSYKGATAGAYGNGTLACPSPVLCVAGYDQFVNVWRNGHWQWAPSDPAGPLPRGQMLPGFGGLLSDLACPTEHFCLASDAQASFDTWDGTTWSASPLVLPSGTLVSGANLEHLQCAGASFCLGTVGDNEGDTSTVYWDGTAWHAAPYEADYDFSQPSLISCSRSQICYEISGRYVARYQFLAHGPHPRMFYAARQEWLGSASVDAAQQGAYWQRAALDLARVERDRSTYAAASRALTNLASLPDTDKTPAQGRQFGADLAVIAEFFGTPYLAV
jgi:hypothetical protein